MIGDKFFAFQKTVAEAFFVGLKKEFGALDDALADNEDVIQKVAKAVGKGLSDAVIMAGNAVKFLHDNFETIKAVGIIATEFSIESKKLTATLKLRRNEINKKYDVLIASLYDKHNKDVNEIE